MKGATGEVVDLGTTIGLGAGGVVGGFVAGGEGVEFGVAGDFVSGGGDRGRPG